MLTPQDIQNKEFVKSVFSGYDTANVDDFLEEVASSYAALYKENSILKSKIKVLVEKVEEYRATEDAMRMALMTAQKMSDDMITETKQNTEKLTADAKDSSEKMLAEARQRSQQMIAEAQNEANRQRRDAKAAVVEEQKKLVDVKEKTILFVKASQQIIAKQSQFLSQISGIEELKVVEDIEPVEEITFPETPEIEEPEEPETVEAAEEPVYQPVQEEEAAPAEESEPEEETEEEKEEEIVGTAKQIDEFVSKMLENDPEPSNTSKVSSKTIRFRTKNADVDWSDDDEPTSPRPKFDFKDLKFGSNYFDEL